MPVKLTPEELISILDKFELAKIINNAYGFTHRATIVMISTYPTNYPTVIIDDEPKMKLDDPDGKVSEYCQARWEKWHIETQTKSENRLLAFKKKYMGKLCQ